MRKIIIAGLAILGSVVSANATPITGTYTVSSTNLGATIVDQDSPFSLNLALNTPSVINLFTLVDPIPPTNGGTTTSTITTTFNFTLPITGTGVESGGETANRSGNSSNYTDTINWNQSANPAGLATEDFSDGAILDILLADNSVGPSGSKTIQTTATFTLTSAPNVTAVPEPLTLSLFGAGVVGVGALRRRRKTNKA